MGMKAATCGLDEGPVDLWKNVLTSFPFPFLCSLILPCTDLLTIQSRGLWSKSTTPACVTLQQCKRARAKRAHTLNQRSVGISDRSLISCAISYCPVRSTSKVVKEATYQRALLTFSLVTSLTPRIFSHIPITPILSL